MSLSHTGVVADLAVELMAVLVGLVAVELVEGLVLLAAPAPLHGHPGVLVNVGGMVGSASLPDTHLLGRELRGLLRGLVVLEGLALLVPLVHLALALLAAGLIAVLRPGMPAEVRDGKLASAVGADLRLDLFSGSGSRLDPAVEGVLEVGDLLLVLGAPGPVHRAVGVVMAVAADLAHVCIV